MTTIAAARAEIAARERKVRALKALDRRITLERVEEVIAATEAVHAFVPDDDRKLLAVMREIRENFLA